MSKIPKIFKYGIELTTPWSKEMYAHNEAVKEEAKANVTEALLNFTGKPLMAVMKAVNAYGFGSGYSEFEMKEQTLQNLKWSESHWVDEFYADLVEEELVPALEKEFIGFEKREEVLELRKLSI